MTPSVPFNPFPGLRHFETSEEYLFFGREGQSEEILRRLGQNRLVAVVGTSGSGKSSLVRAGLLPYLYGGFLANAGSHWRVALFRPGSDPIGNLARSLNSPEVLGAAGEDESDARSAMLLEVTLRRSGLGLVDAVKQARLAAHENVLVIVDQFEELFRFTGAGELNRSEDDAAAFVKLLLEAGQQTDLPVYVALTMRSDWIGDCARFRDLPEAVAAGLYLIPRMTRDQRRAAIEEPVGVAQGQISSRLVNRLLNDVGDNPDQLPILQHAMMRSWDFWSARRSDGTPLDLQDYAAIGTMANALSKHADEAYEELSTDRQRAIAKRIFQALTDKGADNREVRRPTSVAILVQDTGADYAEVLAVIESFRRRGRSFLMPPEDVGLTGDTIIDISHESLIRGWQRLREWVEEESESAKVYRRLADTAVLHAQNKAGLWRDPDLLNALTWRETQHPTNSWAQRYHPQFDLALAFLENSRRERDAERAEEERKRNEELHRTRRQLAVLGTVCAIALAFLASALYEKFNALAKATEANRLAEQYSKQKDYADSNFQRAVIAETQAKQNALAADVARAGETIKKIEAERALVKAREQTEQADRMRTEAAAQAKVAKENEGIALGYARDSINAFNDLSGEIKIQTDVQKFYAQLLQGALDVHTRVLKNDPDNRDALFLGVVNRVTIPDLRNTQGLNAEAEAECAKNEQYAEDESAKTKSYFHRLLGAVTFASTGETWMRLHQDDKGLKDVRRAVRIADEVVPEAEPQDDLAWRLLSTAYNVAGGAEEKVLAEEEAAQHREMATSLRHEALEAYRKAAETRKKSINETTSFSFSKVYVTNLNEVAELEHQLGERDDEITTRTEAIHFAESLAARPKVYPAASDVVFWTYVERGGAYLRYKQLAEAGEDFEAARQWSQRVDPASHEGQVDRMINDDRAGRLMSARASAEAEHDRAQAQRDLNSAVRFDQKSLTADRAIDSDNGTPARLRGFAISEVQMARDYAKLAGLSDPGPDQEKVFNQARQSFRDAIKDQEAAITADPNDHASREVAGTYDDLRSMEQDAGDYSAAQKDSDGAIRWRQPLVSRPSARASDKSALADAYGSRSWLDLLLGQFDQAVNDAETGFSYDGKKLWILTNKAHGLLFLGKQEPALEIYRDNAKRLAYPELNDIKTTFGEAVLDDFAKFRKAPRLNVPALDEAEKTVRAAMAGGGSPAKNVPQ